MNGGFPMLRFLSLIGFIILVATIAVTFRYYHSYQPWLAVHTGSASGQESGGAYAYWSGFGSVFPWELGILVTVGVWFLTHYRLNNCHIEKCLRLAKYPAAGGHFKVCRRHHPESHVRSKHVTFEHVQYSHALHLLRHGTVKLPHKDDK